MTRRSHGRALGGLLALAAAAGVRVAHGSPDLSLDDPVHLELAQLRAAGALPLYLGGLRPLSHAWAHALLRAAGLTPPARLIGGDLRGPWFAPILRLRLGAALARDHERPHSTEERPRALAGGVAITCEHREGEPCGPGAGLAWELDTAAGYGSWLAAIARVRVDLGSQSRGSDLALDRVYASAELGPVRALVGRQLLVLGPSAHTQAIWGDNAPPLDQLRLSTARPIALVGEAGDVLRASGLFFLGRLADPQVFRHALVDGTRIQLDVLDTVELGVTHLIQLGGEGAPDFRFGDYVLEHTRHNAGGSTPLGFANHRVSGDVAISWPELAGLRAYYEVATEDLRDQFFSMLRRDADHVLGLELGRLSGRTALLVELTMTGVRSHEHDLFTTGLTSRGRVVGNPLGPSAVAAHVALRVHPSTTTYLVPWVEVARQSSDLFAAGTGEITRTEDRPDELRLRTGFRAEHLRGAEVRFELRALAERVTTADFQPGHVRWNLAAEASAIWTPTWRTGGAPD